MVEKLFLSTKELAIRWNVSQATLRRWRSENTGPNFSKLGGHASYKIEDIEEFERSSEFKRKIIRQPHDKESDD